MPRTCTICARQPTTPKPWSPVLLTGP